MKYIIKVAYEFNNKKIGQIISRHKSYELARKAAKQSGYDSFLKIEIED